VRFPTKASAPELIIGEVATSGMVAKELLVGTPLSQFPAKFHNELLAPVQLVVLIVNASEEKGSNVSPSPLTTLVQF